MPVRDTSRMALEENAERLGADEQAVFAILCEIGPAHDRRILEALNQKEAVTLKPKKQKRKWEIMSVTGRRNKLVMLGVVEDIGSFKGQWNGKNKTYHFWRVRHDQRDPVGWVKIETRPKEYHHTLPVSSETKRDMSVSEAGRVLVAERRRGRKKPAKLQDQLQLF